jgi:hypothetical protein
MTGDDARYGDVFIERFPTEGVAVQSQGDLGAEWREYDCAEGVALNVFE